MARPPGTDYPRAADLSLSNGRVASAIGCAAALLADVIFYATNPDLRALVARQHWVLYFYLTAMVWPIAAGLALVVLRATRPTRS